MSSSLPQASAVIEDEKAPVLEAKAVALFPPRPDAICTLLHSAEFLPGTQTLLYSLHKSLESQNRTYPPEVVVLVTPNVPSSTYQNLCPALCTRVLTIDEWHPPAKSVDDKIGKREVWERSLDNHCPGWTKMRVFGLQQYETILYIDSDCLVLKDVSHLLDLNKVYTESEALVAAVPDILPPHHFNSGVMVVRPSINVMTSLKRHARLLTTHDRSDTGFLNAYFNTWNTEFPPMARLATGYNAQQVMFDMTVDDASKSTSNFWDVQIASDLHIVHYSNQIKPWETQNDGSTASDLLKLWTNWYTKSKNFLLRFRKEEAQRIKEEAAAELRRQQQAVASSKPNFGRHPAAAPPPQAPQQRQPMDPRQVHKLITKRFKELKRQGMSAKDAMQQARQENGQVDQDIDAGKAVAAMFGMML